MPSSKASSQDDGNGLPWGPGARGVGGRAASLAKVIMYRSCVCFPISVSIFKMLQLKRAKVCLFEAESSTLTGKETRKELSSPTHAWEVASGPLTMAHGAASLTMAT